MRRKVASAVEIFAVKSHLHNAAPEIVISRFAVSVIYFFFDYYSAMNCTFKCRLCLGVYSKFLFIIVLYTKFIYMQIENANGLRAKQ